MDKSRGEWISKGDYALVTNHRTSGIFDLKAKEHHAVKYNYLNDKMFLHKIRYLNGFVNSDYKS